MVAYVIVPGVGGSEEQHWQTRWERVWAGAAVRIEPSSWNEPDLEDWVASVGRAVTATEAVPGDVVIVAHSLGWWAAAVWAGGERSAPQQDRGVRGVMMVAPPDPRGVAFPSASAPTFVDIGVDALPCRSLVVASSGDPYCRLEVAEALAAGWGSAVRVVGPRGHLNSASGIGHWAEGRGLLEEFVGR